MLRKRIVNNNKETYQQVKERNRRKSIRRNIATDIIVTIVDIDITDTIGRIIIDIITVTIVVVIDRVVIAVVTNVKKKLKRAPNNSNNSSPINRRSIEADATIVTIIVDIIDIIAISVRLVIARKGS